MCGPGSNSKSTPDSRTCKHYRRVGSKEMVGAGFPPPAPPTKTWEEGSAESLGDGAAGGGGRSGCCGDSAHSMRRAPERKNLLRLCRTQEVESLPGVSQLAQGGAFPLTRPQIAATDRTPQVPPAKQSDSVPPRQHAPTFPNTRPAIRTPGDAPTRATPKADHGPLAEQIALEGWGRPSLVIAS